MLHIENTITRREMWAFRSFSWQLCAKTVQLTKMKYPTLGGLSEQYEVILAQSRTDGQRTDTLEQIVSELRGVIAMKTPENSDTETQKQTIGVVAIQVPIGPYNRNLGLKLKTEPIMTENSKMYAPALASVHGINVGGSC